GGTTGPGAILGAIVLVVGAPVIEEAYFRGMLYERFARWGLASAVIGTSLLFTVVHGVGIWDPPRLLLGFALGFARRSKSLWFTIAGHAAWNGAIVFIALFMMTGGGHNFTSVDGSFSLRHPAEWERLEQAEIQTPQGNMEVLLTTPEGSMMGVMSMQAPHALNRWNLMQVAQQAQGSFPMPPGATMSPLQETHLIRDPLVTAYESKIRISDPMMGTGNGRVVLVVRDGSKSVLMLIMGCPDVDCAEAEPEFDSMLKSLSFTA
ncbi:MAG TPA: CPBP family intramembrane glutamic endopeptidase, partial [Actinomycetota bacterium]|nr:CPBP family intramembrane glutamic endopeptidase [Actinomycetota bacterium]